MPVAAIAAPVAGAVMGFATTGVSVFSVAAAVGAVATGVGALTGVKELQYAGMALGAVGSIGSVASGAGMFGSTAGGAAGAAGGVTPLASPAMGAPDAAGAAGAGAAAPAGGAVAPVADPGMQQGATNIAALMNQPFDVVAYTTGGTPLPSVPQPSPVGIAQGGGEGGTLGSFDNPQAPGGLTTQQVPSTGAPATPALPPPAAAAGSTPNPMDAGVPGSYDAAASAAAKYGSAPASPDGAADQSIWSRIGSFAEKNQLLVMGALQAGGSFLAGATNPLTPAQVGALESRAELDKAQTDLLRQRASNMRSGLPKASRRKPPGLVNSTAPA